MISSTKWITGVVAGALVTTAMLANPADAKIKEMKFHFVEGQLDNPPAMVMQFKGGKWVWTNSSATFKSRVKIKMRAKTWRLKNARLVVYNINRTQLVKTLWQWPAGYKAYKYEKLITVNVGNKILSAQKNSAIALCDTFGGPKKSIRKMNVPAELRAIATSGGYKYKNGTLPVHVVCLPKTDPVRKTVDLRITGLRLYTVPAKPACGKKVSLVAEFRTNKPGKLKFTLHRKDGNKQNVSVKTHRVGSGNGVSWSKKYTLNKSTSRFYKIVVASPLTTTEWIPLSVNCGASADSGAASAIKN